MTLNDKLEALFRANPGQWLDGHRLAEVAGYAGWRSRCSNLRTQRGMVIENRVQRRPNLTVTEYRWVPPQEPKQASLLESTHAPV